MNEVTAARDRLHQQLVVFLSPAPLLAAWIHRFTPQQVNSPCVWIAQPSTETQTVGSPGARMRVVSFDVFIVADGFEPAQCELLDELVARVSDAIYDLRRADDRGAVPRSIDIGSTTTRAVVHTVDMSVFAHSFCTEPHPTPLQEATP